MFFDVIFMVQHYVLYKDHTSTDDKTYSKLDEEAPIKWSNKTMHDLDLGYEVRYKVGEILLEILL
jgi:hypothetical protein